MKKPFTVIECHDFQKHREEIEVESCINAALGLAAQMLGKKTVSEAYLHKAGELMARVRPLPREALQLVEGTSKPGDVSQGKDDLD